MGQVKSSGRIRIKDLYDVFGGPDNSRKIGDYYRGAGLVPDTDANSGVPTSGRIRLGDFYGAKSSETITVNEGTQNYVIQGTYPRYGYYYGFSDYAIEGSSFGSVSPTSLFGQTIQALYRHDHAESSEITTFFEVSGSLSQNFFTSMTTSGGTTLYASDATHGYDSGTYTTYWEWDANLTELDGSGSTDCTFE